MFQQDSPLMRTLTRIGNMFLISFYWLLVCLPVVTVLPACAALFHTVTKVVRGDGIGVTRDFFSSFRDALKPGIFLSLICVGSGLILYTCIDFGYQMMQNNVVGIAYFAFGCILAVMWVSTMLFIAPALSRFEGGTLDILRIAFCLPLQNVLSVLLMVLLLAVISFLVDFYPVLLIIAPALYTDLICTGVEKALKKLCKANCQVGGTQGSENKTAGEDAESPGEGEMSALEQAKQMDVSDE